jgi:hypothetical protein
MSWQYCQPSRFSLCQASKSAGTIPDFVLKFPGVAFAWELHMPRTGWTPSIVPKGGDQNVYLVVDASALVAEFGGKPTSRLPIWKR